MTIRCCPLGLATATVRHPGHFDRGTTLLPAAGLHADLRAGPGGDHDPVRPVPAIGVYQEIGLDPSPLQNLNPQAYLAQLRDLAPEPRPPATTSRSRGSIWRL